MLLDARSAKAPNLISLACSALYVSEALHLPLMHRSMQVGDLYHSMAYHLPKAMYVIAYEGVLFALTYNGDRFVLFALLPRRKPRTSVQCSRLIIPYSKNSTSPVAGTTLPVHEWPPAWISAFGASCLPRERCRGIRRAVYARLHRAVFVVAYAPLSTIP